MKISNIPTNQIIIKSYSNDWNYSGFAVIKIEKEFFDYIRKISKIVTDMSLVDWNFLEMSFKEYRISTTFYSNYEENPDLNFLEENKGWSFVEISENEESSFSLMESRLICYKIIFLKYGTFYIRAIAKYSDYEYYTEEIEINDILTND